MEIKPGTRTSEFWLTLSSAVIAFGALFTKQDLTSVEKAILATGPFINAGIFTASRTIVKYKQLKATGLSVTESAAQAWLDALKEIEPSETTFSTEATIDAPQASAVVAERATVKPKRKRKPKPTGTSDSLQITEP